MLIFLIISIIVSYHGDLYIKEFCQVQIALEACSIHRYNMDV